MSGAYFLVLGEREAIVWVLREQRMAFPATPRAEVAALTKGDRLYLYATRGAWHNPGRDRGRVIGRATVNSSVEALDKPLEIAGLRFHSGCRLRIDGVVPYPGGVELAPLVDALDAFPKATAWSVYMRRSLVRLSEGDVQLMEENLEPLMVPRAAALAGYQSSLPNPLQ